MKIDYDKNATPIIKEVFSGAYLETTDGNRIGFCMRDDTIEFNVLPKSGGSKWFRIDMQNLTICEVSSVVPIGESGQANSSMGER